MPYRDLVTPLISRVLLPQRPPQERWFGGQDVAVALGVLAVQSLLCVLAPGGGRPPGPGGWALLTGSALVLAVRRRAPLLTVLAEVCLAGPYHAGQDPYYAVLPSGLVALWTLAAAGPPARSFLTLGGILVGSAVAMLAAGRGDSVLPTLLRAGWIADIVVFGEAVRVHRDHVAALVDRAARDARAREREAERRVVEERLRIARDLHDLLAHSITLVGVQTSVAAHVLLAEPARLDRAALARSLDGIADTCRAARVELRDMLEVLRAGEPAEYGPPPGLDGLPDLVRAAGSTGARVRLSVRGECAVGPAVGAAAYRIVQEALTNAVRHGGPSAEIGVTVCRGEGELRIAVVDDGGDRVRVDNAPSGGGGYGIIGMRERARSVGGGLRAGPRAGGPGFAVTAVLPLTGGEVAGR
ncbi:MULTISPECIES: sensor histidine kinase [Streptomyces]|uniref:sensor histidine kinase n=1 Tax=Streptomyces TaxID=1883 RepID=UPI00163B66F0|nr:MULTISPECIES: histidine kinase [Streptomyces]MBC2874946.1 sensor histidine kinase [Streptomyces sp. TYQ1024]UBI37387.1 histidine kinase [Streptomyces mobaraensis]UKW29977.1 histidine kinase [Streptomyces sp. TYQ1024]